MPLIVLSIAVQVLCVVHIMRTGRDRFWIYVIVFLSFAGIAAYVLVEVLPPIFTGRTARTVTARVQQKLDPDRAIRAHMRAREMTDTTENRRLLAEAFLDARRFDDAAELYEQTLVGLHSDDPALLFGMARARAGQGDYTRCLSTLDALAAAESKAEPVERRLFRAICLEQLGRIEEARGHYAAVADRYPGEEARYRYARLLADNGQPDEARRLYEEIVKRARLGNRHYRQTQQSWIASAQQALAALT